MGSPVSASGSPGFDQASANATIAVQNASQQVAQKVKEMDDLIKDLSNPSKSAEAQARLQLLNMQISMITNVMNSIKDAMKAFFQR